VRKEVLTDFPSRPGEWGGYKGVPPRRHGSPPGGRVSGVNKIPVRFVDKRDRDLRRSKEKTQRGRDNKG